MNVDDFSAGVHHESTGDSGSRAEAPPARRRKPETPQDRARRLSNLERGPARRQKRAAAARKRAARKARAWLEDLSEEDRKDQALCDDIRRGAAMEVIWQEGWRRLCGDSPHTPQGEMKPSFREWLALGQSLHNWIADLLAGRPRVAAPIGSVHYLCSLSTRSNSSLDAPTSPQAPAIIDPEPDTSAQEESLNGGPAEAMEATPAPAPLPPPKPRAVPSGDPRGLGWRPWFRGGD